MDVLQRLFDLHRPHFKHLDAMSAAVIDFRKPSFQLFGDTHLYFDLASVSKVLGNAGIYLKHPEIFNLELQLLLEHRASLPAWGLLPRLGWKEIIRSYPIKEADTLYSDYSAMRFTLEIEQKLGRSVKDIMRDWWHPEVCFWRELPLTAESPVTGERGGQKIQREVHDPNAFNLREWTGHAGLFGTVKGVCETLLQFQAKGQLLQRIADPLKKGHSHRFVYGWDRVLNPQDTLAGQGCSSLTFGHLGFTGTSVWIDAEKQKGHVLLSNATRDGWYCKEELNEFRRSWGQLVWQN